MHPRDGAGLSIAKQRGQFLGFSLPAALGNEPMSGHAQPAVFARESFYPRSRPPLSIRWGEGWGERQLLGLLMLHAPNAGKVVVTVGARRGVVRAVGRSARIVMYGRLVVPIHHIQRSIRSHSRMDRAKPEIR